jgi:hypothetical protein
MLKWLTLLIGITAAQAAEAQSFLIYTSQALCLVRSQAQCVALGCDGVHTIYWWSCDTGPLKSGMVGPTAVFAGSYGLQVAPSGPFSAVQPTKGVGLSAGEQTNLKSAAAIVPVLP